MSSAPIADAPSVSRTAQWLVAAGVAATLTGIVAHSLWRELPAERFALSLVLAAFAWLAAWPLRRFLRCSNPTAIVVVWILALAVYVGPVPLIATALLGLAALALGLHLVPTTWPGRVPVATIVGLVAIACSMGWVVTLPIFFWWLWWPLLLAIVLWRRVTLVDALHRMRTQWREAVDGAPRASAAVVILLGLASTACWIPAMQMDDIAYHLNLPTQLMQHGRYAPQPEYQMWSFAPWAGDLLHGVVFMLSRREAHGALNALWLTLAAGAAWSVATSLGARMRERWASVALFASLPPLVWIAAGMQTELAATAILLAFAAVVVSADERRLVAGTILFAGLFALKLVHGLSALPLLAFALWRHRISLRGAVVAFATFAVLASSSYAQSWVATGNPVLPMFNDIFGSPYFPLAQFRDERWFAGVDAALLWRLVFDTDRYVEAWDGGLGFALIALAGAWLLLLRQRGMRAFALVSALVLLLPLLPMQYARYAYPGLALFCVLLPIGLRARIGPRWFAWLIVGVCTLNLAYQANASWLHHSAVIKRTLKSGGAPERVFPHYVPERLLLRDVPSGPEHLVLATDPHRSSIAQLAGRGRTVGEHDPSLASEAVAAEQDPSGTRWLRLWSEERIRWVLVTTQRSSPALRAGLKRGDAEHMRKLGAVELWRLPALPPCRENEAAP
jgi:hypothetical protein